MKALTPYLDRIDALTPRERVVLFVLFLAVLWAVLDLAVLGPLDAQRKGEQDKLRAAVQSITESQQALTRHARESDPGVVARQRREAARAALNARMQEIAASRLVAARDMTQVLQGLMQKQPGLRLSRLDTLEPQPLGGDAKAGEAALYRQGVRITVVGGYADLVRYMEGLEKLPLGFYWANAELDAGAYPDLELSLTLYTLSEDATWMTL